MTAPQVEASSPTDPVEPDVENEQPQPKPTETVEFWKTKARQQEQRAKDNKSAADELAALKDSQKSETQKMLDRVTAAEQSAAKVPEQVTEALKTHLVSLHSISEEDAELFLTATNPDLLLKQVARLTAREAAPKKQPNHVPREGANPTAPANDAREVLSALFPGR